MTVEVGDSSPSTGRRLRRQAGLIGLLWASESSIIGSGWLFGAKKALVAAGPSAVLAWAIGTVAIIILALVHAELGGMFPISGGSARFPSYAFGGAVGASFGWFAWLQAASVAPIEVEAAMTYMQHWSIAHSWFGSTGQIHGVGFVVAIVLMAVFVAVNFLSINRLMFANSAITWWKISVPLVTILIIAVTHFHAGNFGAANGFMPGGMHGVFSALSGSGIIFSLLGFEQAIQLGGESANPGRDLPRATILSILIGAAVYILLQIVFIGALPAANLPHLWADLNFPGISGPWAGLTTLVGLGWLAVVLYIDAVVSPFGTGLIYTTATARYSFGLAKNGYWPKVYTSLTRGGTPWFGLVTSFVIGCICFLPFPSWGQFVGFITSASVLMYAGAPLAFGVFRSKMPDLPRPYRLPLGRVMAPLAFVVANLIVFWSGWSTLKGLGVAILLGYVVLIVTRAFNLNPVRPRLNLRAAQWLPVYLLGIGFIEWISDFGPGHSFLFTTPWLDNWWIDIAAVAAFSLAIYFWAQSVALPSDQIEDSVRTMHVEAALEG